MVGHCIMRDEIGIILKIGPREKSEQEDNTIMKKILLSLIALLMVLSAITVCYAGDIPESLLNSDSAQVYFGEISNIDGESITVIQRQNIKGEFSEDSEHTYEEYIAQNPAVGETYLCAYLNEYNPLYIWKVSSLNLNDLEIAGATEYSMAQRMQDYLNDGTFTEKEQERQAKLESNNVLEMENASENTSSQQIVTVVNDTVDDTVTDVPGSSVNVVTFVVIVLAVIVAAGFFVFLKKKRR